MPYLLTWYIFVYCTKEKLMNFDLASNSSDCFKSGVITTLSNRMKFRLYYALVSKVRVRILKTNLC